jgi:hypothetical protein
MWSSLPSNLRTVLGTALLLGLGVAAAAFTLSFFALRDAAQDPALAWGAGHAWLFPIGVDMALAVPVASILVTLGLAYLLKMLAAASGAAAIHLAPPATEPNRIVRHADVLHGELVRDPQALGPYGLFPPHPVYGQVPSPGQQQAPQNGHGELAQPTKRAAVEMYLSRLGPQEVGVATGSSIVAALAAQGIPVEETYAGRILGEWRVNHPAPSGARKRGSGRR